MTIHTNIEQRELHNPAEHITSNHYFTPVTSTNNTSTHFSSSISSEYSGLGRNVDVYIDELVEDTLQLACSQYQNTYAQPLQHCKHRSYPLFHANGLLPKLLNTFTISRMLTWCLLFWSLSSLVRYALFSDRSLPTREAAPPLPFFGNASALLVEDNFHGNGADRALLVSKSELTIQMFYAPWSLHSMEARQPFMEVADAFMDLGPQTVKFVAINCNDHRGQCRSMYKLYYFPVIFGYVMGGIPIVFNQPLTTIHLFSWVSHLLLPHEHIKSSVDFNRFTRFYDYSLIGYLPFEDGVQTSRSFKVFLLSAYKSAGSRANIGFATFQSSALGEQLGFESPNQLKLYTYLNCQPSLLSSLTLRKTLRSDDVVRWIQESMHSLAYKAVTQLNLEEEELGGKSEMLYRKLNSSRATVVLFSEEYGLPYFTDSHNTLRQVAKAFHNCNLSQQTPSSTNSLREYLDEAKSACLLQHSRNERIAECCASHSQHLCTQVAQQRRKQRHRDGHSTPQHQCSLVNQIVHRELFHRQCCSYYASNTWRHNSSQQPFQFSLAWSAKQACRFLRLMRKTQAESLREHIAPKTSREDGNQSSTSPQAPNFNAFEGLACKTNKSIGFLMIDKRFARYFIQRWGGAGHSSDSGDSLAIVSNPDEKIYWMQEKINKTNLETFLHKYISDAMVEPTDLSADARLPEINFTAAAPPIRTIRRLSAFSFKTQILKEQNPFDSLVFFTGGRRWHGPSQVLAYILHSANDYFHQFDSLLHFYCLDASKQALPWQYTFDSLPALVFFPAYRPMESSLFPRNLPLTIPNLMAFLLSRVQPELRFRLTISGCSSQCLQNNLLQVGQFQRHTEEDVRALRKLFRRQHSPLIKDQFRGLIRRHLLQKRSAAHLQKMLQLFHQSKNQALDKAIEDTLVSDALFVKWLVTNRRGPTFKS